MFVGVAFAQDVWTGLQGFNWFLGGNWLNSGSIPPTVPPTLNDTALINNSNFAPPVVPQSGAVAAQLIVTKTF